MRHVVELLIGVAALLAFLVGCQTQPPQAPMDVEVMVGLQRTACFGRCPVYELSVLNTGEATLKVGRFCDEAFGRSLAEGMHKAAVDVAIWKEATDWAEAMGFDTLQSHYDNPKVMDLPANIVTVNGKTVFNRFGGPNLNELYTRIERLVGATDWIAEPSSAR